MTSQLRAAEEKKATFSLPRLKNGRSSLSFSFHRAAAADRWAAAVKVHVCFGPGRHQQVLDDILLRGRPPARRSEAPAGWNDAQEGMEIPAAFGANLIVS